ncbi:lysophospholipid acyltransferase family protein [Streptomyces noursei]|uniref:lysophospholipid acyltransferase family protein n=1 Tax=Streptomyces noursei TaxID=1971 RepID=UPI00215589F0|nr:lysophospholipid acyltransferase family protein [Streptomyces noursei]
MRTCDVRRTQLPTSRTDAQGAGDTRIRPGLPSILRAGLRRWFWRIFLFFTGGVTVEGKLPKGGCVVVANHSSHADTAALISALEARHAPRVAAASDYWFQNWPRRVVCSVLTAAFPVRRHGGGYTDLRTGAGPMLRAGHAVVLFPEGTRGDGRAGVFHRGPFKLADSLDVPVVPVALCGASELLPKGSKLNPRPIRVRIGTPMRGASADQARAEVLALTDAYQERDSRLRRRVAGIAVGRWGLALAAAWSFAEALSWPLLPELALAILCVAAPRAGLRLTVSAALASVVGGVVGLMLYAGTSVQLPQPLTTDRMHTAVQHELRAEGARAVRHQPASGIPYKVYTSEAGQTGIPVGDWALQSAVARGQRIVMLGLVLTLIGSVVQRWRRFYPHYLVLLAVAFTALFSWVISMWS